MIIFIIPGLQDTSPINWLVSLLLRLQHNFDILVFSMDDDIYLSSNKKRLIDGGVKIVYGHGSGFFGLILNLFTARKLFSKFNPCIIFSLLLRADLLSSLLGNQVNRVSSLRNMIDEEYHYSYGKLIGYFLSKLHLSALKRIDVIVAMSSGMQSRLLKLGLSKVQLIPNGLDTHIIDLILADSPPKLNNLKSYHKIIIVGSLSKRKQVFDSILTLWNLHRAGYFFNIDIIGSGPDYKKIINFLMNTNSKFRSHVSLLGHVDNVIDKLKQADLFLMNSYSEGVSRALMEAMYLGLVVIVRRHSGSVDLIEDKINGYLYDTREEMIDLLKDFYQNNDTFSKSRLPSSFSMEFNINSYSKLFSELDC